MESEMINPLHASVTQSILLILKEDDPDLCWKATLILLNAATMTACGAGCSDPVSFSLLALERAIDVFDKIGTMYEKQQINDLEKMMNPPTGV
jgi:hypothetical protein